MYKKLCHTCKVVFLLIRSIVACCFFTLLVVLTVFLSRVSIWSLRSLWSLRKKSSDPSDHMETWLSNDRSDRSDNDCWDRKSPISAIVVPAIAITRKWFHMITMIAVIAELFLLSDRNDRSDYVETRLKYYTILYWRVNYKIKTASLLALAKSTF